MKISAKCPADPSAKANAIAQARCWNAGVVPGKDDWQIDHNDEMHGCDTRGDHEEAGRNPARDIDGGRAKIRVNRRGLTDQRRE